MSSLVLSGELRYPHFPHTSVRRAASYALRSEVGETFLKRPDPTKDVERLIHDWKAALRGRPPGSLAGNQQVLHLTDLLNASFILGHPDRDIDLILAREDVDRVYKDLIIEDGFWDQPVVFIDGVIEGLFRLGMVAHRFSLRETPRLRRRVLLDKMLNEAPGLWRHLWDNRTSIRSLTRVEHQYPEEIEPGKKEYTDPLTLLAIQYQQLYSAKYGPHRTAPLESYIPHVSLYLWAHAIPSIPDIDNADYSHRPVVAIFKELAYDADDDRACLPFLNEVVPVIGIEPLLSRWEQFLEGVQKGHIDPKHFLEIGTMMQSFVRHRRIVQVYSERTMFTQSVRWFANLALSIEDRQTAWITLTGVALALGDTCKQLEQQEFNACIPAEEYAMHLANGIYLADGRPAVTDMLELLGDAVSRVGVAISESLNTATRQIPAKQYENQLRAAMRHEWWPGLQALRALRNRLKGRPEAMGAENTAMQWYMLGHTFLRLNEGKERKRHEREASRRCSRMACTYHRRVPDQDAGIEMKACTGCREVRYCGRDCQTKDWKEGGHKKKCGNRLK